MKPLSWKELAGVVGVGLAMSWVARSATNRTATPAAHQTAMLVAGAALYTVGVGIGARRPAEGWAGLPAISYRGR